MGSSNGLAGTSTRESGWQIGVMDKAKSRTLWAGFAGKALGKWVSLSTKAVRQVKCD